MVHDSSRLWMTLVIILLSNSIAFSIHIIDKDQDLDNGHDSAQDLEVGATNQRILLLISFFQKPTVFARRLFGYPSDFPITGLPLRKSNVKTLRRMFPFDRLRSELELL